MKRCQWVENKPDFYIAYHDKVWGKAEHDDRALFKWLLLEMFHSGLSWQIVLSKEANFANAFEEYDYYKIAAYGEKEISRLMQDEGIIRNRKKIEAAIANAQAFQVIQEEYGSFDKFIWGFTDNETIIRQANEEALTQSPLSDEVTKALKKYGFKFVGSVTIYSYLQAIGIINDHDHDCAFRFE